MKVLSWIRSRKLWVKILVPVLVLALAAGIYYGTKVWTVVEETKEMVSQIQDTGDFGSIKEEEVVVTYPEYQKDYLNLLVVGIDYDENDATMTEAIDVGELYMADERMSLIANHIVNNHKAKTRNRQYTAIFAVSRCAGTADGSQ